MGIRHRSHPSKSFRLCGNQTNCSLKFTSRPQPDVISNLPFMKDEVSYRGHKLRSVFALGFPGSVVFGILPTSVEFVYLSMTLSFNLQSKNAIVRIN